MKNLHWWLALACIPLYGFWIVPLNNDTLPTLRKAVQVEVEKEAKLNTELSALRTQQSSLQQEGETRSTEIIPTILEQEYLLLDLRRITQGNGFATSGFSFSKGDHETTSAVEMKVDFNATGRADNLIALLNAIEQNKKFLGLRMLSFTQTDDDLVSVNLNLYALAQSHE